MIFDIDTARYVLKVVQAIVAGTVTPPRMCPECEITMSIDTENDHIVYRSNGALYVIVGCEGYWCVDPASVGLPRGNWQSADAHL